jgi:hypothetical protein
MIARIAWLQLFKSFHQLTLDIPQTKARQKHLPTVLLLHCKATSAGVTVNSTQTPQSVCVSVARGHTTAATRRLVKDVLQLREKF